MANIKAMSSPRTMVLLSSLLALTSALNSAPAAPLSGVTCGVCELIAEKALEATRDVKGASCESACELYDSHLYGPTFCAALAKGATPAQACQFLDFCSATREEEAATMMTAPNGGASSITLGAAKAERANLVKQLQKLFALKTLQLKAEKEHQGGALARSSRFSPPNAVSFTLFDGKFCNACTSVVGTLPSGAWNWFVKGVKIVECLAACEAISFGTAELGVGDVLIPACPVICPALMSDASPGDICESPLDFC